MPGDADGARTYHEDYLQRHVGDLLQLSNSAASCLGGRGTGRGDELSVCAFQRYAALRRVNGHGWMLEGVVNGEG